MDKTKKTKPSKTKEAKPDTRKVAVAPKVTPPAPAAEKSPDAFERILNGLFGGT